MALGSLNQQRMLAGNRQVKRIKTDDVALEAYFLYKNRPASQLSLGDIEVSKLNGDTQFDDFLIPFVDKISGFRWCHLEGDDLSVGDQSSEKKEHISIGMETNMRGIGSKG